MRGGQVEKKDVSKACNMGKGQAVGGQGRVRYERVGESRVGRVE